MMMRIFEKKSSTVFEAKINSSFLIKYYRIIA